MKRKIETELSKWKDEAARKPLVMLGCRQVGKTYSIRRFASENYESFLEVNLEREPQMRDRSQSTTSMHSIDSPHLGHLSSAS